MRFIVLTLIALFILPLTSLAQEDTAVVPIRDNLHVLISPMGGNVTVSTGKNGVFIIDDQLANRSTVIDAAIKGISDKPVKFIINTHYHFDHTGGNKFYGEKEAIIVAHNAVRERLSTRQFISFFDKEMKPTEDVGLPVVTFTDNISFHYNGNTINIMHVPNAHTDGDGIAKFVEENVIVAGDVIFNGMYPFIDTEHGGSVKGVVDALGTIIDMSDNKTIIIPGHGNPMNKTEVKTYRNMLETIANRIQIALDDNKTLEEIIAEKPTQEYDAINGGGIVGTDAFVEIVYKNLKSSS